MTTGPHISKVSHMPGTRHTESCRTNIFWFVPRHPESCLASRRAVIVRVDSRESGLPGPGPGCFLEGILLWDTKPGLPLTSRSGIFIGQKERVPERAGGQNGTLGPLTGV